MIGSTSKSCLTAVQYLLDIHNATTPEYKEGSGAPSNKADLTMPVRALCLPELYRPTRSDEVCSRVGRSPKFGCQSDAVVIILL